MGAASGELVAVVPHPVVFLVAHVHDAVVGAEAVSMDRRLKLDLAADNRLQNGFLATRRDLRIDPAVPLVDIEDDGLAARGASALATDAPRAEVTFIEFDLAAERRLTFAVFGDSLA